MNTNSILRKKILSVLIVLLSIECVLQIISVSRYLYFSAQENQRTKQRLTSNWFIRSKINDWWTNESQAFKNKNPYHPFLGIFYTDINTPHINIDSEGRRQTMGNTIGNNNFSIFLFGGSTMAGYYSSDDETIASDLSIKLNEFTNKYSVVNYGQLTFNSNQEVLQVLLLLKAGYKPNVVVFYDGCNDLATSSQASQSFNIINEPNLKQMFHSYETVVKPPIKNTSLINPPLIFNFFRDYIKIIHYPVVLLERFLATLPETDRKESPSGYRDDPAAWAKRLTDNYHKNYLLVESLSKVYGFQYIFIWQPLSYTKALTPEEEKAIISDVKNYQLMKKTYWLSTEELNAKGIKNFYDLTQVFADESKSIFFDSCHISPEANETVANEVYKILKPYIPSQ